jgi:hypothetical protein
MSKADCERFDSRQDEPPSAEFVGAAVVRHTNNTSGKPDSAAIKQCLQAIAVQCDALKQAAEEKVGQFQNPGLGTTSEVNSILQPELEEAWEQLSLAWYELKLASGKGVNFKH